MKYLLCVEMTSDEIRQLYDSLEGRGDWPALEIRRAAAKILDYLDAEADNANS